jgi:hypothetical protein
VSNEYPVLFCVNVSRNHINECIILIIVKRVLEVKKKYAKAHYFCFSGFPARAGLPEPQTAD